MGRQAAALKTADGPYTAPVFVEPRDLTPPVTRLLTANVARGESGLVEHSFVPIAI
jgi:hypothetical protein